MTRRRKLRLDEQDLWNAVASTATPLKPKPAGIAVIEHNQVAPEVCTVTEPAPSVPPFRIGQGSAGRYKGHELVPTISNSFASPPVNMDKKAFNRLKRGKLQPEGRIDLHGMTLARAHPVLTGFIMRSHAEGKRLVLVITGKGKLSEDTGPIPQRRGVLRHQVPHWLRMAPLSGLILQISESHLRHGGSGAYYVYLRRSR